MPDKTTRREIFEIKLRSTQICDSVKLDDLVELTEGYSGAEIEAICREAGMSALRENINAICLTTKHFKEGLKLIQPSTPSFLINLYKDFETRMK